jgi:hypothetical protein
MIFLYNSYTLTILQKFHHYNAGYHFEGTALNNACDDCKPPSSIIFCAVELFMDVTNSPIKRYGRLADFLHAFNSTQNTSCTMLR